MQGISLGEDYDGTNSELLGVQILHQKVFDVRLLVDVEVKKNVNEL